MVRSIPVALQNMLAGSALTISFCVLVTRVDGTQLGFTTYDEDMVISGVTYETLGAVDSDEMKSTASSGVDNLNILGLLTSDLITDADIIAGRYDRASITIFVVDFTNLANGAFILMRGKWGEVTLKDGNYVAELRGLTNNFKQYIACVTSPNCRVRRFCDSQCKLTRATYQTAVTVNAVSMDQKTLTFNGITQPSGYYNYGLMYSTSGNNNGVTGTCKISVLSGGNNVLKLREAMPFPVMVGDTYIIEAGCNRTFPVCASFGNTLNFRGEPFLPGNDQVLIVGRPPNSTPVTYND